MTVVELPAFYAKRTLLNEIILPIDIAHACLAFVGSDFLLWIVLIPPGIWLCSQIQTGTTGVSYIGTQAMFAYLMSMVQGQGPPDSISPGLERLVGVMGGLSILFVVTLTLSLIPLSRPSPASAN